MNTAVLETLESLKFGEPKTFRSLVVIPIIAETNGNARYISMSEALKSMTFKIQEIDEAGSVPELMVVNEGDMPVLIIDGEELMGAKQNRIANSSILVKEKSTTKIPVSCTEAGRWGYRPRHHDPDEIFEPSARHERKPRRSSREFDNSELIMAKKIRARKARAVHESLRMCNSYESDQAQVWADIDDFQKRHHVRSETGAMKDVFDKKEREMDDFLKSCTPQEGQNGLIAFYKGVPVGLEMVSDPQVYKDIHSKLLKSYAIDALLERSESEIITKPVEPSDFISQIKEMKESAFDSVGHGKDYRYEKENLTGSVLEHEGTCIHMAFFNDEDEEMSAGKRRRFV